MGAAVDIDMSERLVEVEVPGEEKGQSTKCYVPCKLDNRERGHELILVDDKLVLAVGSRSNDHGVKGLEHCYQLKTIPDAQAIRRKIMSKRDLMISLGWY